MIVAQRAGWPSSGSLAPEIQSWGNRAPAELQATPAPVRAASSAGDRRPV
eukprot:COSAG04_NODE_3922_length_2420_cov_1.982766_1_plen_50_part_00